MIEPFDLEKIYPVYGFGGIPRHLFSDSVSHCFSLNSSQEEPNITGIDNIIEQYRKITKEI